MPELSILTHLLSSRLVLTKASCRNHGPGLAAPDEIISTNRYIFILRGRLIYEVEGAPMDLREGVLFFVPAGVRRRWWVPRGNHCKLLWCEFSAPSLAGLPQTLFHDPGSEEELEKGSLRRMLKLSKNLDQAGALQIEGELKASLARFWTRAKPGKKVPQRPQPAHPEIRRAVELLERNHATSEVLEKLHHEINLSPNHLRLLFKQQMGMSPSQYLKGIRLRQARILLHQTHLPVKEIAGNLGYDDPLYFSRQYHFFWGKSPSRDRRSIDPGPA